jgi:putative addiction module killer protein
MNQIVDNYVLPDGNEPIVEWLKALQDIKGRAKIRARINQLRAGNPGNFNVVAPGIMEMKLDYGPGYRVYFARVGDKSTQRADIKTATEYLGDYKRRMKEYE